MTSLVFIILCLCTPSKILKSIIMMSAIEMTCLLAGRTRTDECLKNTDMSPECLLLPFLAGYETKITTFSVGGLNSNLLSYFDQGAFFPTMAHCSLLAANTSEIRDRVDPLIADNPFPILAHQSNRGSLPSVGTGSGIA